MSAACLAAMWIASCASGRADDFCLVTSPLRYSDKVIDAMTDAEKADTLDRNRYGAQRCGWKP